MFGRASLICTEHFRGGAARGRAAAGPGRRLTGQAIYGLIARLAGAAGVGELSPHGLRATMVTLALDAGMPLRDVQDSAWHADPRTTRGYDRDRHSLNRHAALRLDELADG